MYWAMDSETHQIRVTKRKKYMQNMKSSKDSLKDL